MQFLKASWLWIVSAIVLVVIAVVVLSSTVFAPKSARAAVQTGQVSRGDIDAQVSSSASLAPAADLQLTFGSAGTITDLNVKPGDTVTRGQVLAKIDDSDLSLAVTQAVASLSSAQAKLDSVKAGNTSTSIANGEESVRSAQAKLDSLKQGPTAYDLSNAQAALASAQAKLASVKSGTTTPQDLANAQSALVSAQAKLDSLKQPPSAQDIANAKSAVQSAQAKLDSLKQPARPEDITAAQSSLDAAKAKLAALTAPPTAAEVSAAQLKVTQAQTSLTKTQSSTSLAKQSAQIALDQAANAVRDAQDKLVEARTINIPRKGSQPILNPDGSFNPNATQVQIDTYNAALRAEQDAEQNMTKAQLSLADAQQEEIQSDQAAQQSLDDAKQQLAALTATPTAADVTAAKAAVDSAQNALDKLKEPASPYDIEQAQAAVDQAQNNLDKLQQPASPYDIAQAQAAVDQAQNNLDKLKLPPTDADVKAAEAGVASAQAALDKLKQPASPYDIEQAQAAVDQAQNSLNDLKQGPLATDVEQAQAAVDQANANLASAKLKLKDATIVAPFSGTIISSPLTVGEAVGATTVVAELVDNSSYHLDMNVDESDITSVKNGQTVDITFDALPDDIFTGTVTYVSPVGTTSQGVTNYLATVTLDPKASANTGLRPGMTATAAAIVNQRLNVLMVPNRAIRTEGGQKVVYVVGPDNSQIRVPVQTGLTDGTNTEITGNTPLRECDSVYLNTTTTTGTTTGGGGRGGFFGGGIGIPGGAGR